MSEFVSKLEEIMKADELNFEPTPAFGRWKQYFPEEAVQHPAKANLNLIEFLIKEFTKEGDLVLDPMAGTGSTCVLASLMGRDSICIDIEEKFVKWMEGARERVEKARTLTKKGKMIVMHGDARELSKLIQKADTVITSPPYSETLSVNAGGMRGEWNKSGVAEAKNLPKPYSSNTKNIGNLPLGSIDAVITSPPYEATDMRNSKLFLKMREQPWSNWYNRSLDGNAVKYYLSKGYESKDNIGNLKGETYLTAMLKVYMEMHKVLKPNGLAIVIIKPFIRDKKVIDLPYYTYLLMKKAGFKLIKLYKLRLEQRSFWRILYERKFPEVPKIRHEYVLVCVKE